MTRLPHRFRTPELRRLSRASLIVLLAAIIAYAYERETLTRDAERTTGRVVNTIPVPSSSTGDAYNLVIRFEHQGQGYQFTSGRSIFQRLSGDWETGRRVSVAFDPDDPGEARLGDFLHVYPIFGTILALAGIVVVVAVIFVIRG